eukprot:3584914-Lingulodinium_polyedra.AAC.1
MCFPHFFTVRRFAHGTRRGGVATSEPSIAMQASNACRPTVHGALLAPQAPQPSSRELLKPLHCPAVMALGR